MAQLGEKTNLDNKFFRSLSIAFMAQWRNQICFNHVYSDEEVEVIVPVYYSAAGDPRFLFEAMWDEMDLCRVEGDVVKVPSIVIYQTGLNIKADELTNPNVAVRYIEEEGDDPELVQYYSNLKAIPIDVNYSVEYIVDSENQLWAFQEIYLKEFWKYKFFEFDYNRLKVEAFFEIPDDTTFEINRDFAFDQNQRTIKTTINIQVTTYLPVFDKLSKDIRYWSGKDGARFGRNSLYAPWAFSGETLADKKVANWLYTVLDEENPEFRYQSVPRLEEDDLEEKLDVIRSENPEKKINGRALIPGDNETIDPNDLDDIAPTDNDFLLDN